MPFAVGDVLRLARLPVGRYLILLDRHVTINRVEVRQDGTEIYFVSTVVSLSVADNVALGRVGPPAPLELELRVQGGQMRVVSGGAVFVDLSAVRDNSSSGSD